MRPYLKNVLYLRPDQTPCEDAMGDALDTLAEEGTSQQSRESNLAFREWRNRNTTCVCGEYDISARWGAVFETDEYRSTEVRICDISFECVDIGERIKLNTSLQKKLNVWGGYRGEEMYDSSASSRSGMGSPRPSEKMPAPAECRRDRARYQTGRNLRRRATGLSNPGVARFSRRIQDVLNIMNARAFRISRMAVRTLSGYPARARSGRGSS